MRQKKLEKMDYFELLDAYCWAEDMSKKAGDYGKPNDYYLPLREEIQKELRERKVRGALEQFWHCKEINSNDASADFEKLLKNK